MPRVTCVDIYLSLSRLNALGRAEMRGGRLGRAALLLPAPRASEMEAVGTEDGRQRTASGKDERGTLLVTARRFRGNSRGSLGEA